MPKAVWNGVTLAESQDTVVVEGNHYFSPAALNREYFVESSHHTVCPWKGRASYYSIAIGDAVNKNAAWFYPDPSPAAAQIRDRVAFWKGVKVVRSDADVEEAGRQESWWRRALGVGA